MAAGQSITVSAGIGDPQTGTISGKTVVAPPSTGNNCLNIDQVVSLTTTPSGDQTIYDGDIVYSKIQALGFVASLVTAGSGTASVTIHLVDAVSGGSTDITVPLTPTQGSPNAAIGSGATGTVTIGSGLIAHDITSITCTPSADGAVVEVQGKIYVTT